MDTKEPSAEPGCSAPQVEEIRPTQQKQVQFTAGGISKCLSYWQTITHDQSILAIIRGYKIEFQDDLPCGLSRTTNSGDHAVLASEISKYLRLNIIEKAEYHPDQIISPIFTVPKKDGSHRMILNLKALNEHVIYRHFKMENITRARELVTPGCYMASVDLEKAYYSVNIHPSYRKYLRFMFNEQLYQYTCLPNGLSSAPYIFTRLMKVLFTTLRKNGHLSVFYLDDSLLLADSKLNCKQNIHETIKVLEMAGFTVNWDKSVLIPTTTIDFLGFHLDSDRMCFTLPLLKIQKLRDASLSLLHCHRPTIRQLAQVIGLLVSVMPAFHEGRINYRELEYCKIESLRLAKGNFDCKTQLTAQAKGNLHWWSVDLEHKVGMPIFDVKSFDIETFSDASLTGYGFCFNDENYGGQWSPFDLTLAANHINGLELLAIWRGLERFVNTFTGKSVLIRCDNTTAVHYVNNMGGMTETCNNIAKEIWKYCLRNNINLTASFISGKDNSRADALSRLSECTELSLNKDTFDMIVKQFGQPVVDLFASKLNAKCNKYVSWKPDCNASAINAFTLNWSAYSLSYCFPPFSLLGRVLQKAYLECGKTMIIVFPMWEGQPWWPVIKKRVSLIMQLPTQPLTMPHPLGKHLRLACGLL